MLFDDLYNPQTTLDRLGTVAAGSAAQTIVKAPALTPIEPRDGREQRHRAVPLMKDRAEAEARCDGEDHKRSRSRLHEMGHRTAASRPEQRPRGWNRCHDSEREETPSDPPALRATEPVREQQTGADAQCAARAGYEHQF
jgi:hypothetical protein